MLPQPLVAAKSAGVVVTPVIVTGPFPVLVKVTFCGSPVVPAYWLGNVTVDGDKVIGAETPTPESVTVCGLPGALSVTLSDAFRFPRAAGVKVTLIVQLAAGDRDAGQSLFSRKSPLFAPVTRIDEIASGRLPLFVRLTGWLELGIAIV